MNSLILLFQNPGNDGGNPACDTPNPPWWCSSDNPPQVPIDDYVWVILGIVLVWVIVKIITTNILTKL